MQYKNDTLKNDLGIYGIVCVQEENNGNAPVI